MTAAPTGRDRLFDVRECRATPRFEIREEAGADTSALVLTGYASTFEPYDIYGGPEKGGWIEQLSADAFTKTLREKPDLHLLINHEGMPLARTKSGTLDLSVDRQGLKVTARLDRSDPDVQRLEAKMRRGDMDEMSFAFRVKDQEWSAAPGFNDPQSHRIIREVSLHKGDVSIVNFGANPTTHAEILGRNKRFGRRKPLSLAEAQVIASAGTAPTVERVATVSRLSVTDAVAIQRADSTKSAQSDSIMRRAEEILSVFGCQRDAEDDDSPAFRTIVNCANGRTSRGMSLDPAAWADYERRKRLKAQKAELQRRQDALDAQFDPSPWGAYGVHPSNNRHDR